MTKWNVLEVCQYLLGAQEEYNWGIGTRLGAGINRKTFVTGLQSPIVTKKQIFHGNQNKF